MYFTLGNFLLFHYRLFYVFLGLNSRIIYFKLIFIIIKYSALIILDYFIIGYFILGQTIV
jgi:hypothetical protein